MTTMEFHLFLPQLRMTMDAIVERAQAAEAAGFSGIAFMDHLAPPAAEGHPMFDAMATASWIAANTSRLSVGPVVLGGAGPRTMELVARHADWWNLPGNEAGRLSELRPAAGRARASLQTIVAYVADEARREDVTTTAKRRFGWAASGPAFAAGTGAELVEYFSQLHENGVERFYTWFTDFAPVDTVAG